MSLIDLKKVAQDIASQDNRSTANPLYCIYDIEYAVIDNEYSSRFETQEVWVSDEGCILSESDQEFNALNALCDGDEITVNGTRYNKLTHSKIPRFVTACLTEMGANAYLKADGHNLNEPYIYVHSLNRNEEMIGLRNFITDTF